MTSPQNPPAPSSGSEAIKDPIHIALETSAVLAYLNDEADAVAMAGIVEIAEQGRARLLISEFAWGEIDQRRCPHPERWDRITDLAESLPTVAGLGTWVLGEHALGHDNSNEIVRSLPKGLSSEDIEQFLAYCAQRQVEFFVTKDGDFLSEKARAVHGAFNFEVGTPSECAAYLQSHIARPAPD